MIKKCLLITMLGVSTSVFSQTMEQFSHINTEVVVKLDEQNLNCEIKNTGLLSKVEEQGVVLNIPLAQLQESEIAQHYFESIYNEEIVLFFNKEGEYHQFIQTTKVNGMYHLNASFYLKGKTYPITVMVNDVVNKDGVLAKQGTFMLPYTMIGIEREGNVLFEISFKVEQ
jgi:hypothetical protein